MGATTAGNLGSLPAFCAQRTCPGSYWVLRGCGWPRGFCNACWPRIPARCPVSRALGACVLTRAPTRVHTNTRSLLGGHRQPGTVRGRLAVLRPGSSQRGWWPRTGVPKAAPREQDASRRSPPGEGRRGKGSCVGRELPGGSFHTPAGRNQSHPRARTGTPFPPIGWHPAGGGGRPRLGRQR